jgi:hypothetical protein
MIVGWKGPEHQDKRGFSYERPESINKQEYPMFKPSKKQTLFIAVIMALVSAVAYAGPCESWWCAHFPNSALCDCEQA